MAYTTTKLITGAYYLSNMVAKGFETVKGDQLHEGLELLNSLLSFKSVDQRMVPYYRFYEFVAEIGVEKYEIPHLILQQSLTFNLSDGSDVRYPMRWQTRNVYFGSARANNTNSLPYMYHTERKKGGSDLYIYFKPVQEYPFQLFGKFGLDEAELDQDLSEIYDLYYIDYLRYGLAEYICQENAITLPPQIQKKLDEFEETIYDVSPIDLTNIRRTAFTRGQSGLSYQQINIGRGYTPTF